MSEELIQRDLLDCPEVMGSWHFYNIGSTTLRALKAAGIIPNRDYTEFESKKPDAIIVKKPLVVAVVEYKQPKELRTDKQREDAVKQELDTARALRAKIYIVTDGSRSFWYNVITGNPILAEDGSPIRVNFRKDDPAVIVLMNKVISSINATNDTIKVTAPVDPLPLAQRVWQDLWSVSGATPENCLYTFVELFIFKYLSDLGVLKGMYSFSHLLEQYRDNDENETLEFYASTVRAKIKELFPGNPRDNTTIINGTIFVSKDDKAVSGYGTVFRRILNRFAAFGPLESIDYDFKSKLFETFLKESISKKNWGQYFTPLKVVKSIVDMADITPGQTICDPACGVGKFLLEPILPNMSSYYRVENGNLVPRIKLVGFDKGFDKDEQKTIILAKANMLIYMSSLIREHHDITEQFAGLFNETFTLQTNSILGTLAKPTEDQYDLILTNPPYVMSGSRNLKEEIAKSEELKKYFSISAMGIEGLFMEWIIRALKPGGKAFVVVPDGIMNRSNDKKLRDFILEECFVEAVISLPLNTFFTTDKKTYILALTKKTSSLIDGIPVKQRQETPVFTYLCSEIGETRDVYRFDIDQNDLEAAANLFNMFKGAKKVFSTNDKRCKLFSINQFASSNNWSVDRWWSQEEKIDLGIEDEIDTVDINGYIALISDAASTLNEFEEPLRELAIEDGGLPTQLFPLTEVLTPVKGSGRFTKTYGEAHKGDYPVYSASNSRPLASIDSYDYDGRFLSWSTNGFAGTINIIDGKFSINGDRGILLPRDGRRDIDLDYLQYTLEPIFRSLAKGRKGDRGKNEFTKLYPSMLGEVQIPLPVDAEGNISLKAQQDLARKYSMVEQCKQEISQRLATLTEKRVQL